MDNIQDPGSAAPSQGQSAPQVQVPNSDASGNNPTSGSVEASAPSEGVKESQFVIPEKFKGKSAEEIAQAYVNLESHNKKVEMEKAEVMRYFVEQPSASEAPTAAAPEIIDEDPMQALRPMLKDEFGKLLSPVIAKMEVDEAVRKYGDNFVKNAQQVSELKKQNPTLTLDAAYKIVAFDNLQRTAVNEGVAQAQKAQEQGQKAQLESSRPSGFQSVSIDEAVGNKSVPLEEVATALGPEYAAFAEKTREKLGKRK